MGCFVVAEFLLTSASRGPSAIAEPLVGLGRTRVNVILADLKQQLVNVWQSAAERH